MNTKQFSLDFMDAKISKRKVLEILKRNIEIDYSNDFGPGMGGAEPDNPKVINLRVIKEIEKL